MGVAWGFLSTARINRKVLAGARASGMDCPRDNFLPDPALARDEDLRIRPCDAVDLLLESGDFGAAAGQLDMRPGSDCTDWAHPRAAFSDTINHCS